MNDIVDAARPAATAIIVRDVADGPPEILMMERAGSMAFAAGALVFPGGAVDEEDRRLAQAMGLGIDLDESAARIAAVRETLEESGLGIGLVRPMSAEQLTAMRAELGKGASLASLLHRYGMELALEQLIPFSRWQPALRQMVSHIFDARFYVVRAPEGQNALADATENVHLFWSSAKATIAHCDEGRGRIIFPTRRNLERLAQFNSFDEIARHAASIPVETVTPWIEERGGETHLCIPDHLGYPVTSERIRSALRG